MAIPKISSYSMPAATELPQNRVEWQAEPQRAALLIHDLQRYFLEFFDTQAAPVPELLANISSLRAQCKALGIPVIYTAQPAEQTPQQRGLLTDFWGPGLRLPEQQAIVAGLEPELDDHVLTKWRYSAFQRTELRELLYREGRDQLIICGIYAHIGCMLTACDAFMQDIQPFLVGDAVADFSLQQHQMAMNYASERCAVTISCAKLSEQLGNASTTQNTAEDSLLERLRHEVAELLQQDPQDIEDDDNLLDLGLDSIRIMSLVERWRGAGMTVEFVQLAEQPTLAAWAKGLAGTAAVGQVGVTQP